MRTLPLVAVLVALALPSSASAIVGGRAATRDYPHMAGLLYDGAGGESSYDFICGGSLVAPDMVLTAAHCVTDDRDGDDRSEVVPPSALRVVLGTRKLSSASSGETLAVTEVLRQPEYDESTGAFDVALIRLERAASRATPIHVAGAGERSGWAAGQPVTVTGWGAQVFPDPGGATISDDLREVEVHVRSDDECASWAVLDTFDARTMLCAGEQAGGKDACQGDSGGPLMSLAPAGSLTLVGVVSKGMGCGFPMQYGVYARVGEGPLGSWLDSHLPAPPVVAQTAAAEPAAAPAAAPSAKPTPKAKPKRKAKAKKKAKHKRKARHKRHSQRKGKHTKRHKRRPHRRH